MDKAVKKKHDKYAPLVHTAHILRLKSRGAGRKPNFYAGAVSHSGEMACDFFKLVEWITRYRKRAAMKGGALYDGTPPARAAAEFRKRFKDGIQTIVARTNGRIMASAGIPGSFCGPGPRRRQHSGEGELVN